MSNSEPPYTQKDAIVLEGEQYFYAHGDNYRNPYPIYSDEFNRFERGWTQALKKTPSDYTNSCANNNSEYPIRSQTESLTSKKSLEQEAAEYKARKG